MPLDMNDVVNETESLETVLDTRVVPHHSKAVKLIERRWKEWAQEWKPELVSVDTVFTRVPLPCEIRGFLLHLTRQIKGQIAARSNITTIETYWHRLERLIHLRCGFKYSEDKRAETRQFIRNALPKEEGLTTKGRHKSLADRMTVIDVLYFLWACDTKDLGHERNRLQLSLAVLMMIYLGLRPGELIESSNYQNSNEGILYKDLTFVISHDEKGNLVYICMIKIRNRKWARGCEKKAYTMILRNDMNSSCLCPLQQILALALADKALEDVDRVEDLVIKYRPPPGQPFKIIPVRSCMRDVPLLRRCDEKEGVDATRIWTYHHFHGLLKNLGDRAGYSDRLLPYNFRRGHGNTLDRFVSAVQRRKQMGHKSEDTFLSYLSDVSGLNVQDIVNGQKPDHALMETLQSMALSYRVPANPPSPEDEDPDIVPNQAHTSFRAGVVRPTPSAIVQLILKHDTLRAKVVEAFYGQNLTGAADLADFSRTVLMLVEMASTAPRPALDYPDVKPIQGRLCPCCGADIWQGGQRRRQTTHLLGCHLKMVRKRAREEQVDLFLSLSRECRWGGCRRDFEGADVSQIRAHLGKHVGGRGGRGGRYKICLWHASDEVAPCRQECLFGTLLHHLQQAHDLPMQETDAETQEFCYPCSSFVGGSQWEEHCDWHLSSLKNGDCDEVIFRGIVIQNRLCPFCIGDPKLRPGRRWAGLTENATVRRQHIQNHVAEISDWPYKCSHPRCSAILHSAEKLLSHCYQIHLPDCRPGPKKCAEVYYGASLECQAAELQPNAAGNAAISAASLFVEESPETGESPPYKQEEGKNSTEDQPWLDYSNLDYHADMGEELLQLSLPEEWKEWMEWTELSL